MLFFLCYFLLLIAASTAAAAAAAAALEEFELLLFVVTPWCNRDFASKCSGFVSRLEDTEATECSPDKWLLLGTILSKNFKLSLRKFCNKIKQDYIFLISIMNYFKNLTKLFSLLFLGLINRLISFEINRKFVYFQN